MKKLIFTLSLFCFIAVQSNAQECGTGPSNCQIPNLPAPGLSPVSDSLNPVIDDVPNATTINFKNFDSVSVGTSRYKIDSLHIDTISNLPAGLCWATSSATNTFANQANGCIQVTGTTNAAPGQYKLHIIVTAYIPLGIQTNADAAGLFYYVRVNCSDSAATVAVDTTGEGEGTAPNFTAYHQQAVCNTAVKSVDGNIQALTVYPNPFTDRAIVSFSSIRASVMTEKITSIIGDVVYTKNINVTLGQNTEVINRNNLSTGVYFYTLSDGVSSFTKRLVIGE